MEISEINQIFGQFAKMQLVVIGDSIIDSYLWGKVERVSPEAPVPVVSVVRRENRLGGAGNVSLNLKELGATPYLFSVVGDDDKGKKFKKILSKEGLSIDGIFEDSARITTVKSRIISKGQHIVRVDEETTENIDSGLENAMVSAIEKILDNKKIDAVIFVDYDKGVITPTLFGKINEMAILRGIPTTVDPKKRNFGYFKNVSLFKPNFKEFVDGIGVQLEKSDFETLKKAAESFRQKQNIKLIFITLSELGSFVGNGAEENHYPALVRDIADVSGAGDTVISVASLAMAAGLDQKTMAMMSNLAGGLVCEKAGVAPINKNQLINEMKEQNI